jgi:hypothetical protein
MSILRSACYTYAYAYECAARSKCAHTSALLPKKKNASPYLLRIRVRLREQHFFFPPPAPSSALIRVLREERTRMRVCELRTRMRATHSYASSYALVCELQLRTLVCECAPPSRCSYECAAPKTQKKQKTQNAAPSSARIRVRLREQHFVFLFLVFFNVASSSRRSSQHLKKKIELVQ